MHVKGAKMIKHNIILHISDRANSRNSVLAAFKETGWEIVSTNSPTEGVALLYIMRSVAAVLLDDRTRGEASFDVAHSLRKLQPNVPIIGVCSDNIDSPLSWTDGCVSTDRLASELQHLLTTEPVPENTESLSTPAHSL